MVRAAAASRPRASAAPGAKPLKRKKKAVGYIFNWSPFLIRHPRAKAKGLRHPNISDNNPKRKKKKRKKKNNKTSRNDVSRTREFSLPDNPADTYGGL